MTLLSGKDDPTIGIERHIEKTLQACAAQVSSQKTSQITEKSHPNREVTLKSLPPPYQKLIIISNCQAIKASPVFQNVSLDSIASLEQTTLLEFIQEQSELISRPIVKSLAKGESFIYRLLRELSEIDRQVREINKSLVKTILSSLTFIIIKALTDQIQSNAPLQTGKIIWRDGIIMKSILAPLIIQEAFNLLEEFLVSTNYKEGDEGEAEGQKLIEKFKNENAILVSIFTDF
jgi:hypothetical protein